MKVLKFLGLSVAVATMTVACGKKESTVVSPSQTITEEAVDENTVEVRLESNDAMQYDKTELRVPVGKTIKLTLVHTGKMAKEMMGHNFVLLNKGVDAADFALRAAEAKVTDYVPVEAKNDMIAYTKMIGGGEFVTVEFTINEPGEYVYLCSFPGHFAIMNGKLIAE